MKRFTKNYSEVPLIMINFDLNKYNSDGAENSCNIKYHPSFKNDIKLYNMVSEVVDYIRENYNMEWLCK